MGVMQSLLDRGVHGLARDPGPGASILVEPQISALQSPGKFSLAQDPSRSRFTLIMGLLLWNMSENSEHWCCHPVFPPLLLHVQSQQAADPSRCLPQGSLYLQGQPAPGFPLSFLHSSLLFCFWLITASPVHCGSQNLHFYLSVFWKAVNGRTKG